MKKKIRFTSVWEIFGLAFIVVFLICSPPRKPHFKHIIYPAVKTKGIITLEQYKKMTNNVISHKIETFWTNHTSCPHQLLPKNATQTSIVFAISVVRESSELVHMVNTYCSPYEIAYPPNIIKCGYHGYVRKKQFPTAGSYENILYLWCKHGYTFGHFFHDSIPGIILTPQEIIDKSMLMILYPNQTLCEEILELIGIPKTKLIHRHPDCYYFAENLYLKYSTEPFNAYNIYSYPKLIQLLKEKTQANSIVGTRYLFLNRKPRKYRYISNFNEFFEVTTKAFPKYKWEKMQEVLRSMKDGAQFYASIKLLVAPSGSNIVHTVFMNGNYTTGVVIIQSDNLDWANYLGAFICGIWMNGIVNTYKHWDKSLNHNCTIQYGVTCIRRMLHALEYGNWGDDYQNDMEEVFDFKGIYKLIKEDPNNHLQIFYNGSHKFIKPGYF